MKSLVSKFGRFIFGILSASFLLACSHQSLAAEAGIIRVGLALQPGSALIILADEQGFFVKEGLKVVVKGYPSGVRALEDGLLPGEVDLASTGEVGFVFKSLIRSDFSILAAIGTNENFAKIVARKQKGFTQPRDVRGKRVATQKGSQMHFFLHMFLVRHGLSEKDISLDFKKVEDLPTALANGEIDAFTGREPLISSAVAQLGSNAIAIFEEPGLYSATDVVTATKKLVQGSPEAVKSILKALIRAEEFAKKQPNEAVKIMARRLRIAESDMANIWSQHSFNVHLPQSLLLAMEDEARWMLNSKLATATAIPNYLNFVYVDGLKAVRPRSVTIIR